MTILENVKVSDMEREEAIALLERYSNYDGMGIQNLAGCKEAMKVAVELLKEAYPELKESEDERIRKFLVDYFTSYKIGNVTTKLNGYRIDDIIAYLEKQKNLDKMIVVSPEVWDGAINDAYENGKKDSEKQKESLHISETCKESHDSFIDGDERIRKTLIHIVKGACDKYGIKYKGDDITEEKLLSYLEKQKEQKPVDLSEMMVHKEPYIAPVPTPMVADEQKPIILSDKFEVALEEFLMNARDKSEKTFAEDVKEYADRLREIVINEKKEQKPAEWSEEDERIRKAILGFLNPDKGGTKYSSNAELVEWSDWLKSIRPVSKESLQPHWKPSEKDEKYPEDKSFEEEWKEYYNNSLIARLPMNKREVARHFYWFAKKQSWKPSEEQIYAIVEALKYLPNNKDEWRILNTLVDVFKKLM